MSIHVDMGWRKREDMCRYGVEEEEGEELGESYVVRSKHMSIIVLFYIGTQIINTYYETFCIL
jgi:hypothetical protein